MKVTLEIPDEIAHRFTARGEDLSRLALEGLLVDELRAGGDTEHRGTGTVKR
jgi:hypothetical protein